MVAPGNEMFTMATVRVPARPPRQRTLHASWPIVPPRAGNRDSTGSGVEQMAGWGATFLLTFLPSLALYGFLTWSVVRFFKRREALYLLVALAPFAWWGFAVVAGGQYRRPRPRRSMPRLPIVPPPAELPDTIVFEGKAAFPKPADIRKYLRLPLCHLRPRPAPSSGEPPRIAILKYDLRDRRAMKPDVVRPCPSATSCFARKGRQRLLERWPPKAADGGPFEMHYVDGAARRPDRPLLSPLRARCRCFRRCFRWTAGAPAGNSISSKDLRGLMLEFMSSSLRPA